MTDGTYNIALAVPDETSTHLLLLPDGQNWTLPRFILHDQYNHLYRLSRQIHDQFTADMVILRTLDNQINKETNRVNALWLMENRTPDWHLPQGARWIDRAGLAELTLTDEWLRPTLETTLAGLTEVPPAARPPWFRPGWFAQAEQWMTDVLTSKGYTLLRSPEQFKQGTISSVLRAETTAGNIYFKVALPLPLFGNEPKLTESLGHLYPDVIQTPLAIDEPRRWMLTPDIGTELRGSAPSLETMQNVVKTFARLQVDTATRMDTLFAVGCLDRRLPILERQIDDLMADEDCYSPLNDDEKAEWRASADQLKRLCQRLANYNLPYTLVHGDFHGGNIALQADHIRFFDWTDACVTHPFFDMAVLVSFDASERALALRDAYLAEWTAFEPLERLHQAYPIALILGALHQTVSYRGIINGVENDQRAGWADGVPFFARQILTQLKTLPEDMFNTKG